MYSRSVQASSAMPFSVPPPPIEQIGAINETVKELQRSIEFMSVQYDEIIKKFAEIDKEREEQKATVQQLRLVIEEKDIAINNLQNRVRESEQYARNRNIEITGLEFVKGENLLQVMKKIAYKIEVEYNQDDIDVIHRVPSRRSNEPPTVIAQFTTRRIRDQWLKSKKNSAIISNEVTTGLSDNAVYLNTHLTPEWKYLLWASKQYGKPKGYKLIWFKEGKIYAKKDVTDQRPVIIMSEKDFIKMS